MFSIPHVRSDGPRLKSEHRYKHEPFEVKVTARTYPRIPSTSVNPLSIIDTPIDCFFTEIEPTVIVSVISAPVVGVWV